MADETHLALQEYSGLYVLDALDAPTASAFEAHLASCERCAAEVRTLQEMAAALPFGVMDVSPPPRLRERVLAAAIRPSSDTVVPFVPPAPDSASTRPRRIGESRLGALRAGWLAAAAMLLLAVAAGVQAQRLQTRLAAMERRLVEASDRLADAQTALAASRSDAAGIRASLALLTSADARDLGLAGQAPARGARGRAFISRTGGLIFAASNLPPLPPARTYQLWYLTAGAPVSAGLVQPDATGSVLATFPGTPIVPEPQGFAVSIEPEGGVPAPTGQIYLATQ